MTAGAQMVTVQSTTRLLQGVEGPAYYPVLNSDGSRLLFSSDGGSLKVYDFADNVVTRVTDDYVAGNDAFFGGDGQVYYVTQQRKKNGLLYRTGHCYDPATGKDRVVLKAQHGRVQPLHAASGVVINGEHRIYRSSAQVGSYCYTRGDSLKVFGVAFVAKSDKIDATHTGFIVMKPGEAPKLRHASSLRKQVVEQPLLEYLVSRKGKLPGITLFEFLN